MRIVAPENLQSKHDSFARTLTGEPVNCIHFTSSASCRAVSTRRPSKYTISASFSSVVIMAGVNSWGSNPGYPGVWMHVRVLLQFHAEQSVSIPEYIRHILARRSSLKLANAATLFESSYLYVPTTLPFIQIPQVLFMVIYRVQRTALCQRWHMWMEIHLQRPALPHKDDKEQESHMLWAYTRASIKE